MTECPDCWHRWKYHGPWDEEEPLHCQRCDLPFLWHEGFVARYVGSGDTGWFYCSPDCLAIDEPKAFAEPLQSDDTGSEFPSVLCPACSAGEHRWCADARQDLPQQCACTHWLNPSKSVTPKAGIDPPDSDEKAAR